MVMVSDEKVINYKSALLHLIFLCLQKTALSRAVITSSWPCLEKTS
jgi:hypothetical protein